MSQTVRIILAVVILVALVAIFVITFILYRRTPAPKGMEDLKPDDMLCEGCQYAKSCDLRLHAKQEECAKEKTEKEDSREEK